MRTDLLPKRGLLRVAATLTALSLLVGCGGGGGGTSGLPPTQPIANATPTPAPAVPTATPPASITSTAPGIATFSVSIPLRQTSALLRDTKFISPNAQSVVFTTKSVNGTSVSPVPYNLDLVASNPNCVASGSVLTCTANLSVPLAANNNAAQNAIITVQTYPQTGGQGSILGQSDVGVTLYANAQNRVTLTVAGTVAGFYLLLSSSKGTAGTASTTNVNVVPTDASGAIITGSGAFSSPIQLVTNNPHVLLSLNGGTGSQTATVSSFTDTVQLKYDGDASVPNATVTGSASGISGNAVVTYAIARTPLTLSAASTAPYVSTNGVQFDAPTEVTTLAINGGLAPYTVTSGNAVVATGTVTGTALAVNALAFGATTLTVTDAALAQTSVVVAVAAPPLGPPAAAAGAAANPYYNPKSNQFTFDAPGKSTSITIVGGQPPFTTTSSNTSVISAALSGPSTVSSTQRSKRAYSTTFIVTANGFGTGVLTIKDSGSAVYYIPAVVTATPLTATGSGSAYVAGSSSSSMSTSPSFVATSIATGIGTITPAGGAKPYSCSSSATAVATATLDSTGATCTISTVGFGSAIVSINDAAGSTVPFLLNNSPATFAFTVTSGTSSYNGTAKAFVFSGAIGQTAAFTLSGGATPYTVAATTVVGSSAPIAVSTSSPYTITTTGFGSSILNISSANGSTFTIPVAVAPSILTVTGSASSGATFANGAFNFSLPAQTGTLAIAGGAAPFTCTTSSSTIVSVAISGATCTLTSGGFGTALVTVKDSVGQAASFNVQTTAAVFGLGIASKPIANSAVSISGALGSSYSQAFFGGVAPYTASTTIPGVVTPTIGGSSSAPVLTYVTVGYGVTNIVLRDASGQQISLPISVSPSALTASAANTTGGGLLANGALTFPSLPQTFTLTVGGGKAPYTLTGPSTLTLSASSRATTTIRKTAANAVLSNSTGIFNVTISDTPSNYSTNALVVTDSGNNTLTIPYSVAASGITTNASTASFYQSTAGAFRFTAPGQTAVLSASGGYPPYTYATGNALTASFSGNTLTAGTFGTTVATVTDSRGNKLSYPVVVAPATGLSVGSSSTNYNGAKSTITFASGLNQTAQVQISGGAPPYTANVLDKTVAIASNASGIASLFTVQNAGFGTTPITFTDSAGQSTTIYVVSTSSNAQTLGVTSSDTAYLGRGLFVLGSIPLGGKALAFTVNGGTGPYTATYNTALTSTATSARTRAPRGTQQTTATVSAPTGNFTFTIPQNASGASPSVITIVDAANNATTVAIAQQSSALTATASFTNSTNATFTSNPYSINLVNGSTPSFSLTFGGGAPPYTFASSNSAVVTISNGTSPTTNVTSVGFGTAIVSATDSLGNR